jgi:hypothetical protein
MANINIEDDSVSIEGGGEQTVGERFIVTFTLNNLETVPSFGETSCVPEGASSNGHRAKAIIEVNGETESGETVDRTVDLGERCVPINEAGSIITGNKVDVTTEIAIDSPGNYSLRFISIPMPQGTGPISDRTINIDVVSPGEGGTQPGNGGGGGNGGNGDNGNGGKDLLAIAVENPIGSLVILGGVGAAINSAFGE